MEKDSAPIFKVFPKTDILRKTLPYSEFLCFVFFLIGNEYEEIRITSPYSVQMQKNRDQKNSEYGHFSYSDII